MGLVKRILIVSLFFAGLNVYAQDNGESILHIKGMVEENYEPLGSVHIEVIQGNKTLKNVKSNQKGEFDLELKVNETYSITFEKADYVSKKIFVDAGVPEGVSGSWTVEFSIGLFKMYEGLDVSALNDPVTRIVYIEDDRGFGYDRLYTEKMMAKIDKIMRQLEALKEEAYRKIIRAGDQSFDDKKYTQAIEYYQKALDQRPDDRYPRKRLEDAQELLKEVKQRRELYEKAIARADQLFEAKKYSEAKTTYYEAIDYDQSEEYPHQQIQKIDDILNRLRAERAAEQEKLRKYDEYIRQGDAKFEEKDYSLAKLSYQNALGLFPDKTYPQEQINKINSLIAQQQQQEAMNNKYNELIAAADQLFNQANYSEAKARYSEALSLKSSEYYPKQQIEKIDQILADLKAAEEKYQALIQEGDHSFSSKQYQVAKGKYNAALQIKGNEQYPQDQIARINEILQKRKKQNAEYAKLIDQADAAFNQKQYTEAKASYSEALFVKPNEQYPKDQIAKIDAELSRLQTLNQNYNQAIKEADQYFAQQKLTLSKSRYQEALNLKPGENYPKQRLEEIDQLLARQAENDKQYASLVAQADQAFASRNYEPSKSAYQQALEIKPNEEYPKNRIKEIDQLLAKLAADREKQEKYNALIAQADMGFNQENYTEAKATYSEALFVKPNEQYPKDQIAKIDNILAEKKRQNAEREAQQAAYDEAIQKADGMFAMEEYVQAKTFYNEALTIKPNEQYPKTKINEINTLLNQLKEAEEAYQQAITQADQLFSKEEYENARSFYNQALEIKSQEAYPRDQIAKIDKLLADLEAKKKRQAEIDAKYKNAIATADQLFNMQEYEDSKIAYNEALKIKSQEPYPKDQIRKIDEILRKQQEEIENSYNQAIQSGDQYFRQESWEQAKNSYLKASGIKPEESYPKNQIKKIDEKLAGIKRQKQEQERIARLYTEEIEKADKLYKDKDYYTARTHYQKALQYKPGEEYPENRLKLIQQILSEFEAASKSASQNRTADNAKKNEENNQLKSFDEFKTKAEQDAYLNNLAKEYPEGVTIENYDFGKRKVKRVIVNYDGVATDYRKVQHSWGGTYYFRNGQTISQAVFNIEIKKRD